MIEEGGNDTGIAEVAGLYCPACGYDMRGATGDRCSECGLVVDRQALKVSGFAWAHRREIGRVRAYLKTVWQVLWGGRRLRNEASKDQDPADARSFRRVTAVLLATSLAGTFVGVVLAAGGTAALAEGPTRRFAEVRGPALDLLMPWGQGAVLWPVMPACLVMWSFYVTGVQRAVFRTGHLGEGYRERAAAVALYAGGPLALVAVGPVPALIAALVVAYGGLGARTAYQVALAVAILDAVVVWWGILAAVVRAGQWAARSRHAGLGAALLGAGELVGLWVLGTVLLLGLLPWCIGFVWIVLHGWN